MFFDDNFDGETTMSNRTSQDTLILIHGLRYVKLYYLPLVVVLGILGNIFTLLVLLRTQWGTSSVSPYIMGLSISDTLFLVSLVVAVWLPSVSDLDLYHNHGDWCFLVTYITNGTEFLSMWLTVGMNVDRFLMMCFPSRRKSLCNPFRSKVVVGSMFIMATIVSHNLGPLSGIVHMGANMTRCSLLFADLAMALSFADAVCNKVLPYVILFILDAAMLKRIVSFYSRRNQFIHTSDTDVSVHHWPKQERGNTKLVLYISCSLIALTLPSHVRSLWVLIRRPRHDHYNISREILLQIPNYLLYTRSSVNFYLFCAFSPVFRSACESLFTACCAKNQKGNAGGTRRASQTMAHETDSLYNFSPEPTHPETISSV